MCSTHACINNSPYCKPSIDSRGLVLGWDCHKGTCFSTELEGNCTSVIPGWEQGHTWTGSAEEEEIYEWWEWFYERKDLPCDLKGWRGKGERDYGENIRRLASKTLN